MTEHLSVATVGQPRLSMAGLPGAGGWWLRAAWPCVHPALDAQINLGALSATLLQPPGGAHTRQSVPPPLRRLTGLPGLPASVSRVSLQELGDYAFTVSLFPSASETDEG